MEQAGRNIKNHTVDFEPVGRRASLQPGGTILEAAQASGVGLVSLCGGEGWCESCVVRLERGTCQPPTGAERLAFSPEALAEGYRLACQARPRSDVKVYLPPSSLSTPQRLQVEGEELPVALAPQVCAFEVVLSPPSLTDLLPDTQRLKQALAELGRPQVSIDFPLLGSFSNLIRQHNWQFQAILSANKLVALLPSGSSFYGLAVDIGTTKLAGYLVNLVTGEMIAKAGAMNPQIAYGEDVISRIAYSQAESDNRARLQSCLIDALNAMLAELCQSSGVNPEEVVQAVVVGNTAMHHFFAGLPVKQLAMAPYVPATGEAIAFPANQVGLRMAPNGFIQLLPNIAGYVGADHVAVLLATEIWKADAPTLVIDIGTNTEISLAAGGTLYCCSCASGPAFEGAHIRDGMRAADGAIESFQLIDGRLYIFTIGSQAPVGICGSGILDVVAELRQTGILDRKGAIHFKHANVVPGDPDVKFVLVGPENSGHGKDISITRRDVNEIQLAKAAIRAGIDILLETAKIQVEDLQKVVVAGAFGTYIRLESAIRIGMLPDLPLDRFTQVGNAAGMGAKQVLLSANALSIAEDISQKVHYVELTTHPDFQARFLKAMYL